MHTNFFNILLHFNSSLSLSKILSDQDSLSTEKRYKLVRTRTVSTLSFFNQHENEEYLDRIKNILQLLKKLFYFLPEVPESITQFFDELSKNLYFISLDTIQNYSLIPFLSNVLSSFEDEEILYLTLNIIDYLLNLDFSMLAIMDQNDIFAMICNFFEFPSDKIHIQIANIFHSAVLYDNSDDEQSDQIEEDSETLTENNTIENLPVSIFNKILNLFFQQSYIWSADVKNEDLQLVCLDFELILFDIVYKYDQFFAPFSIEIITTLCELYLNIIQVCSEKLKAMSISCSLKIMIHQKVILYEPSDIFHILFQLINLEDSYIDKFVFNFLAAFTTLIKESDDNISFLHDFIDFKFLCEKMVSSSNQSAIFYICLLLDTFINNGPDSINILLNSNFLECCKQRLLNGNIYYCKAISASIKDIFLRGTADQILSIFQSGVMASLFHFFDDSLDDTTPTFLNATCNAIQKCTEELGSDTFQSIQTMFFNDLLDILLNLRNSKYEKISSYAERLLELLEFDY